MSYFAEIENGIVKRVIVADTKEWCEQKLGGMWVETFMDRQDKNYAGIGHTYDVVSDNFITPKVYDSWILNDKQRWEAPVATPENLSGKAWSEKTQSWKSIDSVKAEGGVIIK